MSQNILVINSGSSSIKFSLFDMLTETEQASGLAERLGSDEAELTIKSAMGKNNFGLPGKDYTGTLVMIMDQLQKLDLLDSLPVAIGHRVVHGGEAFSDPVIVNHTVLEQIKQCVPLAPLHNPAHIAGIEAMAKLQPSIPQVAVFDTSFHQSLEPKAFLYGLPYELYEELSVRRYGFHGVSHQYVSSEAARRLNLGVEHGIISAHLGNGCSACAIKNGKSVDTTMGMTPLEGLVMGTRSGDIDPSLHQFLKQQKGWDIETITNLLNKESGLLGLSGLSNDMRTVEQAASEGNARAALAIDVFCFKLARHIAGLAASLSRLDALVFTGGIGENSRTIRKNVIGNLSVFGFSLNDEKNMNNGDTNGVISNDSGPSIIIINTKEELMIAKAALALI